MTAAQHTPGPWKVYRNSKTRKLHAARQTAQGLEFLVTQSGHPREFKAEEAARAAIAKAEGERIVTHQCVDCGTQFQQPPPAVCPWCFTPKQTNHLEEHAYREQLENEDEASGTPAPMPWWLIALIFTVVCAVAGWVAA